MMTEILSDLDMIIRTNNNSKKMEMDQTLGDHGGTSDHEPEQQEKKEDLKPNGQKCQVPLDSCLKVLYVKERELDDFMNSWDQ